MSRYCFAWTSYLDKSITTGHQISMTISCRYLMFKHFCSIKCKVPSTYLETGEKVKVQKNKFKSHFIHTTKVITNKNGFVFTSYCKK